MKHKGLFSVVLGLGLLLVAVAIVGAWPPAWRGTDDEETHEATNFTVYYTDDCASYPSECITATRADVHGDHLDDAWNAFVSWGFNPPTEGGKVEAWVIAAGDLSCGSTGCAKKHENRIEVIESQVRANATARHPETPHHELMHREQNTYAHYGTTWEREGTAALIQDSVFDDVDRDASSSYVRRANRYLSELPRLDEASYIACLFFKYYVEQIGTWPISGPGEHMDALVWFWENADLDDDDNAEAVPTIINRVLATQAPGVHFEDLFHDFIVTNYVKGFSNVSSRFRYEDEQGPNGTPYNDVDVEYGREPLSTGSSMAHLGEEMPPWGARYFVEEPVAACPFVQVDLDGDPGDDLAYTILATRGSLAYFHDDDRFRTWGEDFQKTLYNDSYDEVVAVVGGGTFTNTFDVRMDCVAPELEILWPTWEAQAMVGDYRAPRRFILRLSVTSGDTFVEGLDKDAFNVTVGGDEAPVIDARYVQSQYWLVIDTPTQGEVGSYGLVVRLDGGVSANEPVSVHYDPGPHYDHILVVDRSSSMGGPSEYPKLLAAKNAAKLYVDEAAEGDKLGVLSFATTPSDPPDYELTTVDNSARENAKLAITDMSASGLTSIGGALEAALDEFDARGTTDKPDYITLLSDGIETADPRYDDVRERVMNSGIRINAVALGPLTDEELLQRIVSDTTGIHYFYADVPSGSKAAPKETALTAAASRLSGVEGITLPGFKPDAPAQGDEWAYRLSGIYDFIEGQVSGYERIMAEEGVVTTSMGWYTTSVYIDSSVSHATFSLAYEQLSVRNASCGVGRHVNLRDPDGDAYKVTRSEFYHDVFEVASPQPGRWQIGVQIYENLCAPRHSSAQTAAAPYRFLIMVSGQTDVALELYIGTPVDDRLVGARIPILAILMDRAGLVAGATLEATVTGCGNEYPLTLQDDGSHDDGDANDGVYGALFTHTTCAGSYVVEIESLDGKIVRQALGAFYTKGDADADGDSMPDGWEQLYGLDPALDDSSEDPDLDFLSNADEFDRGTNPMDDDTDGGGEMDSTETVWSDDPINDPDDDSVNVPQGFRVEPGNGLNVLRYDVDLDCNAMLVLSSTLPSMVGATQTAALIENTGVYTDTGLTNGTRYYYRLACVSAPSWPTWPWHISGLASRVAATPKTDPIPPEGDVFINDDAETTTSRDVTLTLLASPDTVEMMISNDPGLAGAHWEPFAGTKAWTLEGDFGEAAFAYAAFRDGAGNVSDYAGDGIMLVQHKVFLPITMK